MKDKLISKGVVIPAPGSIVLEDIDENRIFPGAVIYPGTILRGKKTFIGRNAIVGEGGGALVENAQIGANARIMQGVYRDCTLLDGVIVRNGAEIREGCLLEEGAELGHTVGLKQTILFPDVVAGSLINFCDALMAGGTSRKVHSEIGSCMALYNYTPQGDKFASIFGDVEHGVFLSEKPVFVGGQTQIISPVHVGFGSVIAAGSKLAANVSDNTLISTTGCAFEQPFEPVAVRRPDIKVSNTSYYIEQLRMLKSWYENVRLELFAQDEELPLFEAAIERIQSGMDERVKRLKKFVEKIPASLEVHRSQQNLSEIDRHQRALDWVKHRSDGFTVPWNFADIIPELKKNIISGMTYPEAVRTLHASLNHVKK